MLLLPEPDELLELDELELDELLELDEDELELDELEDDELELLDDAFPQSPTGPPSPHWSLQVSIPIQL